MPAKSVVEAFLATRRGPDGEPIFSVTTWTDPAHRYPRGLAAAEEGRTKTYDDPEAALDALESYAADVDVEGVLEEERPVPVVMTYGAGWTLAPVWGPMARRWDISLAAKSRSFVYAVRARRPGTRHTMLVIWDIANMDRRGLDVWAEATGSAGEPAHVVAARYLRRMLMDTPEIEESQLGTKIMTATGMARAVVRQGIGTLEYAPRDEPTIRSLRSYYAADAAAEAPRTWNSYATRRACSRGGFVFAAARSAGEGLRDVIGFDESSAHHAAALAHMVPERWREGTPEELTAAAERVVSTPLDDMLRRYAWPWPAAFNALIRFEGLRLREGSVWEREEIGLLGQARMADAEHLEAQDHMQDPAAEEVDRAIRGAGYRDRVEGATWAYGHLMEADLVETWVTDIETWCMAQVYDWDRMEAIEGEITGRRKRPDDQGVLATIEMYAQKAAAKARLASMDGDARREEETAYVAVIKARYNSIGYGIHAQDDLRPGYEIGPDGDFSVTGLVTDEESFERATKGRRWKAWYVYGMRIAGWSRAALIAAAELMERAHPGARLVAGDTDSLKYAGVTERDFVEAAEPLHEATALAIARVTSRAARSFPEAYRGDVVRALGRFEPDAEYDFFFSGWPKAYVGIRGDGAVQLKLAGVPRSGEWSLEAWLSMMIAEHGPDIVARVMAPGVILSPGLSQIVTPIYPAGGGLPDLKHVAYNIRDTMTADVQASIAWQRAHGRRVEVCSGNLAGWVGGRALLHTPDEDFWS